MTKKIKTTLSLAAAAVLGALVVPPAAQSAVNYFDQTKTVTVSARWSKWVDAHCPVGYKVTGGGYFLDPGNSTMVIGSLPYNNGWRAFRSTSDPHYLTAYAICVQ